MIFLLHFIFISAFTILLVVSIRILRPFRKHKKRPVSTILLKVSYLLYLVIFLLFAYLVLFFSRIRSDPEEPDSNINTYYYIIVIIAFLLPNLGIMIRRRVNKLRTYYNAVFTGVNLIIVIILVIMMFNIPWEF